MAFERRVTIICSNMAQNCLGRSLLLGQLVRTWSEVRVIGVQTSETTWLPGETFGVPIEVYRLQNAFAYRAAAHWIRGRVEGSRVIVCKPKPTSLGLAILAGLKAQNILLDIDDWDVGFLDPPLSILDGILRFPRLVRGLLSPTAFNTYLGVQGTFGLVSLFPSRIVSNGWLEQKYGGEIVPHVRDTTVFDPGLFDREMLRRALSLSDRVWVAFIGTARRHKGIDDLISALGQIDGTPPPGLLLAGIDENRSEGREIVARGRALLGGDRVRVVGPFPFGDLPKWLSVIDIVCIPSLPGATSNGQIPAKLFDGLAMGKAIVISDANDTRNFGGDVLARFPAGDVAALANILKVLCADENRRTTLGVQARQFAVSSCNHDTARKVLLPLLDRVVPFTS